MSRDFLVQKTKWILFAGIFFSFYTTAFASSQMNFGSGFVQSLQIDANGKSLESVLDGLVRKGGPNVHMAADFGKQILHSRYSADSWAELLRQLLSGYNYYSVFGKDTGQITDVYVLGASEKSEVKPGPPVEAEKIEKPSFCNEDSQFNVPGGGPRNLARIKKKACGEQ